MCRLGVVATSIVLALGACFFTPPFMRDDQTSDAAPDVSAMAPDGSGSGSPCPDDDMSDMSMRCGEWGTPDEVLGGVVNRGGGELSTTVGGASSHAECVTPTNIDFSRGVSIELLQPVTGGSGDTTRFVATFDAGGAMTIETQNTTFGLQISAKCSGPGGFNGPVTYSAAHRWLKIGVMTGSTAVSAEYGADGIAWSTFGSCSLTGNNLAFVSVRFGAIAGSPSATRSARFDNFRTCTTP